MSARDPQETAEVAVKAGVKKSQNTWDRVLLSSFLAGALVIDRNVLEWRLDPTSPHRLAEADDPARRIVVVCNEGYSSSLAAATLRRLGVARATDLVGGYQAWLGARTQSEAAPE